MTGDPDTPFDAKGARMVVTVTPPYAESGTRVVTVTAPYAESGTRVSAPGGFGGGSTRTSDEEATP